MAAGIVAGAIAFIACVGDDPETTPTADDAAAPDAPTGVDGGPCATACLGVCVDTTNDRDNCGACGKSCKNDAGVSFACVASRCGNELVQVSSGFGSSCLLLREGSAWCWGDQQSGLTGTKSATPTPTPTKVPDIADVVEIGVGSGFAVARRGDGSVVTWGIDDVKSLPLPAKATHLAVGYATACTRLETGAVLCKGISQTGLLGLPPGDAGTVPSSQMPIGIVGLETDVVQVSISNGGGGGEMGNGCAVKGDGTVWCWGANTYGQLGHASNTEGDITCENAVPCNLAAQSVKASLGGAAMTGFAEVHVGDQSACGLKKDGTVWCWGTRRNGNGGLGNSNDADPHPVPAQVPALNTTKVLAYGWNVAFAVDQAGGVRTWGVNNYGTLGVGNQDGSDCFVGQSRCRPAAVGAPFLQGVKQISIRSQTAVALREDGAVLTWGWNRSSQLGHAPQTNDDIGCADNPGLFCNPTPTKMSNLP